MHSLKGTGFKANFLAISTGEPYGISDLRKDGAEALYGANIATEIDEDLLREFCAEVRQRARAASQTRTSPYLW